MRKPQTFILLSGALLIMTSLMIYMVWDKTIIMAGANHWYAVGDYEKAQSIYEDLAVDAPNSPPVLHNISLSLYQQGRMSKAAAVFQKAIPGLNAALAKPYKSLGVYFYDYGNILYKNAAQSESEPEQALKLYTQALAGYKKALQVNPLDNDAKYNYELARLHMERLLNQPHPKQNQRQEIENILKNSASNDQYKARLIPENNPSVGKDW
ncbi:MAG: hypothetical protein ACM3X9_02590 [Bacillota bacterium]